MQILELIPYLRYSTITAMLGRAAAGRMRQSAAHHFARATASIMAAMLHMQANRPLFYGGFIGIKGRRHYIPDNSTPMARRVTQ